MDKVLLIDGMGFIWRSSISFGLAKQDMQHRLCYDCDSLLHNQGQHHCVCGANWNMLDDCCENSPNEDHVIIFNFFRNLRPIIEQFSPDKCFFVLEGHPQFRYDLYSDYKANRLTKTASVKGTKEKIYKCKDEIVRLLQFLPITICKAANYEADDTIATICNNLSDEDLVVLSNDSDYIQLLQRGYKNCKIYNPIKKEFMTSPDYPYIAWKCLSGDKSDNIPSLLKPKQVIKALSDPNIFSKFMAVEENRSRFNINRQLIEFRSVPEEEIELVEGIRNFSSLKEEFSKMKFESIINDKSWERYKNTFNCIKY